MPHFVKRGRKFGMTSASLEVNDFRTTAVDINLDSVSANDDTFATAKAIKAYVDATSGGGTTFVGLSDTDLDDTTSYADNQNVQYDSGEQKWINRPYLDFDAITEPAAAAAGEARLYVRALDSANDALAVKLKKATNTVEVILTSPEAICECGSTDGAKDPIFNFVDGTIIVELYCGHSYQMDIPNLRRIQ